jgi:arylsulfatase A-like enzyme
MEFQNMRDEFILAGLLISQILTGATAAAGQDAAEKPTHSPRGKGEGNASPNIVLILTDQQHAGMLSCAGNPWVKTPNMDRIAAGGARFERAYCSNPVCVPSRFSMFTGVMPSVIGMEDNSEIENPVPADILFHAMGNIFRRAGYVTAYAGKPIFRGSLE